MRAFIGHKGFVKSVAISPDKRLLASGATDGAIRIWRATDGTLVREHRGQWTWVTSVVFSPDGKLLIAGPNDCTLRYYRISDGALVRTVKLTSSNLGIGCEVLSLELSPDKKHLLATANTAVLIRLADGRILKRFGDDSKIHFVSRFSPDGRLVAIGGEGGMASLWRVSDGKRLHRFESDAEMLWSLAFSPDGKTLVAGVDTVLALWQIPPH